MSEDKTTKTTKNVKSLVVKQENEFVKGIPKYTNGLKTNNGFIYSNKDNQEIFVPDWNQTILREQIKQAFFNDNIHNSIIEAAILEWISIEYGINTSTIKLETNPHFIGTKIVLQKGYVN